MRFLQSIVRRVGDKVIDSMLRNLDERIRQIVSIPVLQGELTRDVELASNVEVPVEHGLGRRASVFHSSVRNPSTSGRVEEVLDSAFDPSKYVVLRANGYAATVTVDVWVF